MNATSTIGRQTVYYKTYSGHSTTTLLRRHNNLFAVKCCQTTVRTKSPPCQI